MPGLFYVESQIADGSSNELRQRLDEITGRSFKDIDFHPDGIEALNATRPHTIKYIGPGGGDRSDCMLYALEIPTDFVNVAATFPDILEEFFDEALSSHLEQAPDSDAEQRIIVYFKDDKAKHIGRVTGNRVISKWGKNRSMSTVFSRCRTVMAMNTISLSSHRSATLPRIYRLCSASCALHRY
jgi:hypothetical protein